MLHVFPPDTTRPGPSGRAGNRERGCGAQMCVPQVVFCINESARRIHPVLQQDIGVSKKSACGVLFRVFSAVSLSPLRGSRAGNSARKPCTARLPNPPHMSPDSDCIWRATALQTSRNGFLTVCSAASACHFLQQSRSNTNRRFPSGRRKAAVFLMRLSAKDSPVIRIRVCPRFALLKILCLNRQQSRFTP